MELDIVNRNKYFYVYADFDECSEGVQNDCPEVSTCINTDGDYFCDCMDGYNTVNKTKSCDGKIMLHLHVMNIAY